MSTFIGAGPPRVPPRGGGGVLASALLSCPCSATTDFTLLSTLTPTPTPCVVLEYDNDTFTDQPRMATTSTTSRMHLNATGTTLSLYALFASFFDALGSVYLPFLWESLLGGIAVMRYALLGQLFEERKSMDETQSAGAVTSCIISFVVDPAAASCLTCLALLAFVAMAVHPEGLTWVAVRKVRDMFISFLQSSSTCWSWLVNDDTGVISTMLALATFCTLVFFCYVLHRTLAPKQPRSQHQKKIKTSPSASPCCSESQPSTEDDSKPSVVPSPSRKRKKKKSSAKKRSGTTGNESLPASIPTEHVSSREDEPLTKPPLPCPTISRVSAEERSLPVITAPAAPPPFKSESPPRAPPAVPKPTRVRVESTSTVDTAASSVWEEESSSVVSTQHPNKLSRNQNRPKRNPNHNGTRNRNNNGTGELVIGSRWDALKPESPAAAPRVPRKPTHKSPIVTPNRTVRSATRQHRDQLLQRDQHQNIRATESVQEEPFKNQSFFSVESPPENHRNLSPSPMIQCERTQTTVLSQLLPLTNMPPPQTPSDSFFSDLNPRTPPFAPIAPAKVLRAPPGLSLPDQVVAPSQTSSFFLPPYRPSFDAFPPVSLISPPPGLIAPPQTTHTGATLPNGSCSPLCLRPGVGKVRDNPFEDEESEAQIEAELQELGGRMIENVLDF